MVSGFQFLDPSLIQFDFKLHDNFLLDQPELKGELEVPIGMRSTISRDPDEPRAIVTLFCEIGQESDDFPYYISAAIRSVFRWDSSFSPKVVTQLLERNAPSLLLSYLRPIVAQVTGASSIRPVNIPFLDFTKLNPSKE